MPTGDIISKTLTWPVADDALSYVTTLRGVADGLQSRAFDVDTTSWEVDVVSGTKYHQETTVITNMGSRKIKILDFIAGQPEPPPTNLQVTPLGNECLASYKNIVVTIEGFAINSEYKDGTPVVSFSVNGEYIATWFGEDAGWEVADFVGWIDEDVPRIFNPFIACSVGQYGISRFTIPGSYTNDDIIFGTAKESVDPEDPTESPTTGGKVTIKPQ